MNKLYENVLLSFWLPMRKSNFINLIDSTSKDNLINKITHFAFDYHLDITEFDISLNSVEYNSIFKLKDTKHPIERKRYVQKHLSGDNKLTVFQSKDIDEEENEKIDADNTITTHQYRLLKRTTKLDGQKSSLTTYAKPILLNFIKSNLNTSNDINRLHLQFKFTEKSIKIFKYLNLFKDDLRKLEESLLKGLEFNLFIDEYGFYFIDTKIYDNTFAEIEYPLIQLFVKAFFGQDSNHFNILTDDQKHIINDGLLFEYNIQNDTSKDNLDKKENFFKKIIKVYYKKNFINEESFDILPSKELTYILDQRNDEELKRRIYNIPFLDYSHKTYINPNKLVQEWILNTDIDLKAKKVEFLYKLFLQDQIEKNAMSIFLEVATSITYIGQIINKIKSARDDLRTLITNTTESNIDHDTSYRVDLTEEQLSRYIEKIFSKIPNLKTIDTFLQEAYYIKIGNFSFISHIEDTEKITALYQYIKWKNLLENIDNTALSLETILQVYQNRQSLEEIAALRKNELSTSDKNDVKHLSNYNQQSVVLDESQRDFFVILSMVVAFVSVYKDLWSHISKFLNTYTNNELFDTILTLLLGFIILGTLISIAPSVYKMFSFSFSRKEKSLTFLGINTIEMRSKKSLDCPIEQNKEDAFTDRLDKVLDFIEDKIAQSHRTIIQKGRRRVLFTKVNPRKRSIQVKYIFDKDQENDHFDLDILGIENKKLKIKFFVVYSFVLELNKETDTQEIYDLYNNSAKVYFNIGYMDALNKDTLKEDETQLRKKFHSIFLEQFIKN
ncbi:MAG: hypothetical protein U9N49_09085 [Campylobacterota bacterium]|nr:hypothetical protein [Campylobacterota bacterium]